MSRIEITNSLKVAHKVVKELEKIIPAKLARQCRVSSWANCREQGLCIEHYPETTNPYLSICIAESRNSDEILVVHGHNFDIQTNQPNDEAWDKNCKYFSYNEHSEAAEHILKLIKENK